jgi:uncharacterized membrane protein
MQQTQKRWTRLMQSAYCGVLIWQVLWLGLLPQPTGPQNGWLAAAACILLFFPLVGIIKANHRSMIFGGVILIMYFTAAVTEFWTTADHRWPASVQILLVIIYIFAFRMRIKAGLKVQAQS